MCPTVSFLCLHHISPDPFSPVFYVFIQNEWVLRELVYLLHISFQSWGTPFCPDEDLLLFLSHTCASSFLLIEWLSTKHIKCTQFPFPAQIYLGSRDVTLWVVNTKHTQHHLASHQVLVFSDVCLKQYNILYSELGQFYTCLDTQSSINFSIWLRH